MSTYPLNPYQISRYETLYGSLSSFFVYFDKQKEFRKFSRQMQKLFDSRFALEGGSLFCHKICGSLGI